MEAATSLPNFICLSGAFETHRHQPPYPRDSRPFPPPLLNPPFLRSFHQIPRDSRPNPNSLIVHCFYLYRWKSLNEVIQGKATPKVKKKKMKSIQANNTFFLPRINGSNPRKPELLFPSYPYLVCFNAKVLVTKKLIAGSSLCSQQFAPLLKHKRCVSVSKCRQGTTVCKFGGQDKPAGDNEVSVWCFKYVLFMYVSCNFVFSCSVLFLGFKCVACWALIWVGLGF